MKTWLRAIGFFRGFWLVSLIPFSIGGVLGRYHTCRFDWRIFLSALAGVWLFHAGTNLLNDYYDYISGADNNNPIRTPFSGGTLVIQEGLLQAKSLRNAGYFLFVIGAVIFGLLSWLAQKWFAPLAILGAAAGIFYTAPPFKLAYRGYGEVVLGLTFGPAICLAGYMSQKGPHPWSSLLAGVIPGLISAAIIIANEIPDIFADTRAGKRTLAVRMGNSYILDVHRALIIAAPLGVVVLVASSILPGSALISLITYLPIAALVVRRSLAFDNSIESMISLCRLTIISLAALWIGLIIGLLISSAG